MRYLPVYLQYEAQVVASEVSYLQYEAQVVASEVSVSTV